MAAIPLQHDKHDDVFYPTSDGKPMAETALHQKEMIYLIQALDDWFEEEPDVYVGGNMLFYYVEGDPRSVFSPDVFVTRGISKEPPRECYKLWEEGRPPCLIVEVTSRTTRREDLGRKRSLYESLGVEEYFLHDPRDEYLRPCLQGYRLTGSRYQEIASEADGSLMSRATGLRLRREGEHLRLIDPATGRPLPSFEEYREESLRKDRELQERDDELRRKEEELRRLNEEMARLRRES